MKHNKPKMIYIFMVILLLHNPFSLIAFEAELKVYNPHTHEYIGTYQRFDNNNEYQTGVVIFHDKQSCYVLEKPLLIISLSELIGYIKNKNTIRESGPCKKVYLYKIPKENSTAKFPVGKRKHNHLIS